LKKFGGMILVHVPLQPQTERKQINKIVRAEKSASHIKSSLTEGQRKQIVKD
jgi:polysaccharide deacetylase 2 family uncharacterized protein YibQ